MARWCPNKDLWCWRLLEMRQMCDDIFIKRDWPRWNLSAYTTQFEEGVREWDRESERSLGSGSSPSLWLNVSGSCEERQSSQLLSSLEVTQNLASGARVGWAGAFSAVLTSALRVDGWMLVWRTSLQSRCTWPAGNEQKCQNLLTREFVKGRQGVFSEVGGGQCERLESRQAGSSFDVWLTGWLVNERRCRLYCIGTHMHERRRCV